MPRNTLLWLILSTFTSSCSQTIKAQQSQPSAIPALRITNDSGSQELKISKLSIDVVVVGNIATTTFDITFYNSWYRVLEGEFDFPLSDGQNISRYALDINGSLREGVIVEKMKARIAFENTTRRRIDPGLVEKTRGNNFRTRIYPIPARGYKRVVIATEQSLSYVNKDLIYQLPLYASGAIGEFFIKTTVLNREVKPLLENNELSNFQFKSWRNAYVATYEEQNFIAQHTISFTIPFSNESTYTVFTENYNGQTYFYINSRIEPVYKSKPKPATIAILWDVSGSGEKRNITKELEILKQYLSDPRKTAVTLIPFSIVMQGKEEFIIDGNPSQLIQHIKGLAFDGGTQLGAIDLTNCPYDEVLLFTDGLSTFGKKEMNPCPKPVTVINSSPSADYAVLKNIALKSHGTFIDLNKMETATALKEITHQSLQLISFTINNSEVEELYSQSRSILNNGFSCAGIAKQSGAKITVNFGFGTTITERKTFVINPGSSNNYDNAKKIWASMKIGNLELEYDRNKEAITELGKDFSIVTQNTSLIVLDLVEDYVQYEIVPPAELQKQYYVLLKEKHRVKENTRTAALNEALRAMDELKAWWNNKIEKHEKKKISEVRFSAPVVVADDDNAVADSGVTPMQEVIVTYGYSTARRQMTTGSFSNIASGLLVKKESEANDPAIELSTWKPDAPYLKILEVASENSRYSKYLELKKEYQTQPSFFVDVARFFIEKKNKPLGIMILSNVAEMKLEDAELSRILANQLAETEEQELAIEMYKEIISMREEEPQSYRDLALSYNEAGKYNDATALLYKLVLGTWDARFGDVKAIALNEMNAIISAHKGEIDISGIDNRFIYAMPVDIRIVVGWSSNESDVDLWVSDPHKEKCYYQNTHTGIGGKISKDVTQGYGPEEYSIKKAVNGEYLVEINLYGDSRQTLGGPITVKADLFTDFGKATQKRKTINLRITSSKDVIKIGTLTFNN